MDFDPTPFNASASAMAWLKLVGVLGIFSLLVGLVGAFLSGGDRGGSVFSNGLSSFLKELVTPSPRRIFALTGLTLKEAFRRKALIVFVVFAVLLMFGGWFLTDSNERIELQRSVHVTFMLTTISWLILPAVMFLSCWGIPEDIRVRSLHTVVTKPARRIEVVLGRILGFSLLSTIVLVLMAVVGYIWIVRQYPVELDENGNKKDPLACRVPHYGVLYFINRNGLPVSTGVNVGDPWMYRSFVQGNSRARAVWVFGEMTPERVGDKLRLESRFEAFRTIKGTNESIESGLEVQYTLVKNLRNEAFSSLGVGASFRPLAEAMVEGNFQTAADLLDANAERMQSSQGDFPEIDCYQVSYACSIQVVPVLETLGDSFSDLTAAFTQLAKVADRGKAQEARPVSYPDLARACTDLASVLRERGDDLYEAMPVVEVPLEPFRIQEYHEGEDFNEYSRTITYAADYESTARFLADRVATWNEAGTLIDADALSASLAEDVAATGEVSELNAELLADVLQSELDDGALEIADSKLSVADGSSWLKYFTRIVREEKLIAQDPAGWVLEVDLFDDLTTNDQLRIDVACLDDQMYLGMARADLFIRLDNVPFLTAYSKAILNIGLMLALVIVLGVTASCVVKGPVSFFFTLTVFVIGQFFHTLMLKIISPDSEGGGLLESAVMIFQHRNPNVGMDASETAQTAIGQVDNALKGFLGGASKIIPDFRVFSDAAAYIENGFDVPWNSSILPAIATFVGFLIPCIVIGAACLKFRELEAK